MQIKIVREQVINPCDPLRAIAFRAGVADFRAGISAGFQSGQRDRDFPIEVEILLIGFEASQFPVRPALKATLERESRAVANTLDLAREVPGMAVLRVKRL